MILPDLADVPCDEVGFPQCVVIPIPDMIWATVELNEEWDRSITHVAPRTAVRRKERIFHQMLEECRFSYSAIPDNGNIIIRLCAELCKRCDSPILRFAEGLKAAVRDIPLRQKPLYNVQIVKAAAFPVGGGII